MTTNWITHEPKTVELLVLKEWIMKMSSILGGCLHADKEHLVNCLMFTIGYQGGLTAMFVDHIDDACDDYEPMHYRVRVGQPS